MKSLFVALLAVCVVGCGTIGTYAGMNVGLGYEHNYGEGGGFSGMTGSSRGNIGANQFYSGGSYFRSGGYYPNDTISTSVTILLRPEKE